MSEVVITGAGIVSPAGCDTRYLEDHFAMQKRQFSVSDPIPRAIMPSKARRIRLNRLSKMAVYAAWSAIAESGFDLEGSANEAGIALGSGAGGLTPSIELVRKLFDNGLDFSAPALFPDTVKNAPASQVAITMKIQGINLTFSGPHSAMQAINESVLIIKSGKQTIMLAGGCEDIVPSECEATAIVNQEVEPDQCGEGAYILCFESKKNARKRGARVLAEVATSTICHGVNHTPSDIIRHIKATLHEAAIPADQVGKVFCYGINPQPGLLSLFNNGAWEPVDEILGVSEASGAACMVLGANAVNRMRDTDASKYSLIIGYSRQGSLAITALAQNKS